MSTDVKSQADASQETIAAVDDIVSRIGQARTDLIPLLQAVQDRFNYLPPEALVRISQTTEITPAQIVGVATFYNQFRLKPTGSHVIKVCHGTACHVAGAPEITAAARRLLGLSDDEEDDTDTDRVFTVTKVACLGCCSLAPVMQIDDVTYGHLTPGTVGEAIEDFLERQKAPAKKAAAGEEETPREPADIVQFRIGMGSCCQASGSADVRESLEDQVGRFAGQASIKVGGCVGMCHRVPLLEVIHPDGRSATYGGVTAEMVPAIVRRHLKTTSPVRRLTEAARESFFRIAGDPVAEVAEDHHLDLDSGPVRAFLHKQKHVALELAGHLDPLDLDEYCRNGGFDVLRQCIEGRTAESIIDGLRESGLRGRGGAGFLTATKWERTRAVPGDTKYVICNGDEGDPGAFMDRMLLESYPFRILEGMAIAAHVIGSHDLYLYVRAEYPLAVKHLRLAIAQAVDRGYLGEKAFEGRYPLRVAIKCGAGAFVSGEETALLASVEGRRASPRFRPPYPAQSGLHGCPTLVNNVETFACVPWILRNGPDRFAALGTHHSRGTKVFALAGRIKRGGLIEVPMGITVREVVDEIGGGIRDDRTFKAVQIGGPSGGCVPADLADISIDYEELSRLGAIMGSGGLVVMDDRTCMVDVARYFLQFTQDESCGKCTFCRIGTKRMLEILDRLCAGQGKEGDIELLADLAAQIKATSLCGLGKTAPNPIVTTIRYFRDEYEAHIEGRCPAGVCPELIRFDINDKCIGCTLCVQHCPVDAIPAAPYEQHEITQDKCIRCGTCRRVCPVEAVDVH